MIEEAPETPENNQTVDQMPKISIYNLLGIDESYDIKSDLILVEKTNNESIKIDVRIDYKKWIHSDYVEKFYHFCSQTNIKDTLSLKDTKNHHHEPKLFSIYQHDIESLKYVFSNSDESTIISFIHLFMHKYQITNYTDFIILLQEIKTPLFFVPMQKFFYSSQFESIVETHLLQRDDNDNNDNDNEDEDEDDDKNTNTLDQRKTFYNLIIQTYEEFEINDKFININNWYTSKQLDTNSYFVRLYPPFFQKYYKDYSPPSCQSESSSNTKTRLAYNFIMKAILVHHAIRFFTEEGGTNFENTEQIETIKESLLDEEDELSFFQEPIIMFYILSKLYTVGMNIDKTAIKIPIDTFFESKTNCIYPILYGKEDEKSRNNFLNNITKYGLENKVTMLNMTLQSYYNIYISKRPVKFEVQVDTKFSDHHGQFHIIDTVTNTIISHLLIEIKSDPKAAGNPLIGIV